MSQLFNIQDDKVIINKLLLSNLEGTVAHNGSLTVSQGVSIAQNLVVQGRIIVDVIEANQIINKGLGGGSGDTTNFQAADETGLNGQGVTWTAGDSEGTLVYRPGNRLYSNMHVDLERGRSYKIDNIEVLSYNTLGSAISRSSLRTLGPLNNLTVVGNTVIGEHVYIDTDTNRVGFGTESPNSAFSVVDNGIELVLGSPTTGQASIGTYTSHDLALVTDNIPRITIKNGGDVHFGSAQNKSTNLYVHGTFYADNIVSDTRTETTQSVEFISTADSTVYGKGLIWSGTGSPKQIIMRSDPDRLWSTESLELQRGRYFAINEQSVLTEDTLGASVTKSSLTSVGTLTALSVAGASSFAGDITADKVNANELTFTSGSQALTVSNTGISANLNINVSVGEQGVFYADSSSINFGNANTTARQIRMFGSVAINVNNPDPDLSLAVAGNIGFAGRKFITGSAAPIYGNFTQGDICWNDAPSIGQPIGWVCINAGTPGMWAQFGIIS